MMATVSFLSVLVTVALLVTIVAPVVLVLLWIKEWKEGQLW